jgi:hypothetical protein
MMIKEFFHYRGSDTIHLQDAFCLYGQGLNLTYTELKWSTELTPPRGTKFRFPAKTEFSR